jgi:hypothetical protein
LDLYLGDEGNPENGSMLEHGLDPENPADRTCIPSGSRGRFFNVVDLVNKLEMEARTAKQARLADNLTHLGFVLDERGHLPLPKVEVNCYSIWSASFMSAPRSLSPPIWPLANGHLYSVMPG